MLVHVLHIFYYCRYVLDGYPVTKSQISLLNKYEIIPVTIVELNVSDEQMLVRAEADRNNVDRYSTYSKCTCTIHFSIAYSYHVIQSRA